MNFKKMILLILLVITVKSYGQKQKVADRYFEEFSYLQSAKLYKALIEKKADSSKHILSRLAESYYNNADTEEAEFWYKELLFKYKKDLEDKHL